MLSSDPGRVDFVFLLSNQRRSWLLAAELAISVCGCDGVSGSSSSTNQEFHLSLGKETQ